MNNNKRRDKSIKKYVEAELENYQLLKKEREEIRAEIILSTLRPDTQPKSKQISRITENKSCDLTDNIRLRQIDISIKAIEKVLSQLEDEKRAFIKCKYWERRFTAQGLADRFNINLITAWRWSEAVIEQIAREMGIKQ